MEDPEGRGLSISRHREQICSGTCDRNVRIDGKLPAGQGDRLSVEGGIEINRGPVAGAFDRSAERARPLSARVVTGKKPEPFGKEGGPAQAPPSKAKRSRPLRRRTGRGKGKEEKESLMRAMS